MSCCRAAEEAELRFRMDELEALENTLDELEGGPSSSLPPMPAEYQNWRSGPPSTENMPRPRCVAFFDSHPVGSNPARPSLLCLLAAWNGCFTVSHCPPCIIAPMHALLSAAFACVMPEGLLYLLHGCNANNTEDVELWSNYQTTQNMMLSVGFLYMCSMCI